ncbi:LCP family protein [Pedococcus sp. KACC 23699]|uniref:LCP family protein n=1 Tax=Pedococcus sp. KACC 23699 TaxID=3149228 RepID=A0AAU7JZ53_9MICO
MSEPTNGSAPGSTPGQGAEVPVEDTSQAAGTAGERSEGHQGRSHRHPWMRRALFGVAGLMVLVLVLGIAAYVKLNGNISRVDITSALGDRPKQDATTDAATNLPPVNIMVIGSDSRAGTNLGKGQKEYGITGARSDTNLVVHLAADRKSAIVVSIPRDSMTMAPRDCNNKKDTVENGVMRQWNANFTLGGPACTIRTFEGLTGIYVDHFVVIDFRGFQKMVDALGGVTVCLPEAVKDPQSHLDLPAGRTRVNGTNALAYVRVRHNIGDGSDLGRIDRQQAFLSSVVQEATQSSLLLRPDKLFRFLDAATGAMTTDTGLDVGAMKDIAQSVQSMGTDQIRFVKLPTTVYAPDPNRVQWLPSAESIWKSIREDKPLPGTKVPKSTKTPSPTATTSTPALTVAPGDISVRVTNDSGVPGLAKQAASDLSLQGFRVQTYLTGTGDKTSGVVVRYGPGKAEAARTVAAVFPGAKVKADATLGSTLEISMGLDSPAAVEIPNRTGTSPLPKPSVTATSNPTDTATIAARTANTDICK